MASGGGQAGQREGGVPAAPAGQLSRPGAGRGGSRRAEGLTYPSTPHLYGSYAPSEKDVVLTQAQTARALSQPVLVYEKVDGLNVGLRFRDRGAPTLLSRQHGELHLTQLGDDLFGLASFAMRRLARLWALLGTRYVAYGEWLGAHLGVRYARLPDWLLFFDLLDARTGRFLEVEDSFERFAALGLPTVPCLYRGKLGSAAELSARAGGSVLGASWLEGWVLRRGRAAFKFVLPHHRRLPVARWAKRPQRLAPEASPRHELLSV